MSNIDSPKKPRNPNKPLHAAEAVMRIRKMRAEEAAIVERVVEDERNLMPQLLDAFGIKL